MSRRRLGLDEIAHYRESYGDQLRTALLAGKPTAALRRALTELDEQERDAHASIAAEAAANARWSSAGARSPSSPAASSVPCSKSSRRRRRRRERVCT